MSTSATRWLERIKTLPLDAIDKPKIKIMNVCGGHERSITMAGLRKVLPEKLELVPGPGCPVCICPEEDVFEAIQLALNEDIILVAFGDMLRVPGTSDSLLDARAAGGSVKTVYSPLDAVELPIAPGFCGALAVRVSETPPRLKVHDFSSDMFR